MAYTKMTSAFKGTKGFDILKDDGSFKSTFEIIKGIGSAWKELTDMQKSKLLQDMFGKLQGNVGAALLENYEKLDQVVSDIENTTGSVDQEFERYLDSTTGKINQLSSLVQEKWTNAISSDFTKNVVDGVTKLVDAFGNLKGNLAIATTAVLVFKGQALSTLVTDLMAVCAGETAATIATTGLSAAFKSLSAAMASNPIGLIAIAVAGIATAVAMADSQADKLQNTINDIKDSLSQLDEVSSSEKLVNQYKDLNNTIYDTTSTTEEVTRAKEDLLDVQKQLAEAFPELITGFTEEGEAVATNLEKIEERISSISQTTERELQSQYQTLEDILNSKYTGDNKVFKKLPYENNEQEEIYKSNKGDESFYNEYKFFVELQEKSITLTEDQQAEYKNIKEYIKQANDIVNSLYSKGKDVSGMKIFDFETNKLVDAQEYYDKLANSVKKTGDESETTGQKIKELYDSGYSMTEIADKLGLSLDVVSDALSTVEDTAWLAEESIKSLSDAFDGAVDNINLINTALEEYSSNGGLSDDTISKILNTGDLELIQSLLTEDENYMEKNSQLLDKYTQAKADALQQAVNEANGISNAQADATNQNAQSYQADVDNKVAAENEKLNVTSKSVTNALQTVADLTNSSALMYQIDAQNKVNTENSKASALVNTANQGIRASATLVNTNGQNYNTDQKNFVNTENAKSNALGQANNNRVANASAYTSNLFKCYDGDNTNYVNTENAKTKESATANDQRSKHTQQWVDNNKSQYEADYENYKKCLLEAYMQETDAYKKQKIWEAYENDTGWTGVPAPNPNAITAEKIDTVNVVASSVPVSNVNPSGGSGGGGGSSSSSSTDYSLDDLESMRDNLYEINSYIERLETAMGILEAQIDRTWGKDKVDKIRAYNKYLQNQLDTTRNLQSQQQKEIFEIRKKLSAYGFDFDPNDITSDITNYNTRIDQLVNEANAMKSVDEASRNAKQQRQQEIREIKELCDDYNSLRDAINDTKVEYEELATQMQEYYRGLADDVASGESTIATIIESAWEDKANKIKDSLDELQQKYEDLWEREDWEDTKAEAYKELTDLEVEMQKAIKSGNTGKLAQLQEEYNERQEELNKTLRDKEREDLQDKISQEQELIDKQKEEATTGDNMDKAIEQALKKGYIDLSGEYKTLADATEEYVNKTTDGYESQKLALSDIIKELETVKELYKDISTINSNADVVSDFTTYNNVSVPVNKSGYLMTSNSNSSTPNTFNNQTYNITINAADMTQSELENAIDNVLRDNGVYDN